MLLAHLGETRAAERIEETVAGLLRSKRIPALGSDSGFSTSQVGDLVLEALETATVRS
jgi:3-isopropylmalate dehydrogenase